MQGEPIVRKSAITNLERRTIEANILASVLDTLCGRMPRQEALEIIGETTRRAAWEAGAIFARQAADGPCLAHFATILDVWQAGDALRLKDVRLMENSLTFSVTHCRYVDIYREMGLGDDLIYTLSCARDFAFAQAYSPRLTLDRPTVISRGAPTCDFTFTWRE